MIGPTARIGWGTPTLVTIDVALVLELPAPVRLIILGRLRALLPDEQVALLRLQMDVVGEIDFDRREAAATAVLVDSRLASFPLTGAMAMKINWGDKPAFLLAVGGFNLLRRQLPRRAGQNRRRLHPRAPVRGPPRASRRRLTRQLKLWPQPQLRWALGLLMLNPAPWRPSL